MLLQFKMDIEPFNNPLEYINDIDYYNAFIMGLENEGIIFSNRKVALDKTAFLFTLNDDFKNMVRDLLEDSIMYRIYGPVNSFDSDGVLCGKYGCLMRLCNCNYSMTIEEMIEVPFDWLSDECEMCKSKITIENIHRIPMVEGGWYGSFCSWDCVLNRVKSDYSENYDNIESMVNKYKSFI